MDAFDFDGELGTIPPVDLDDDLIPSTESNGINDITNDINDKENGKLYILYIYIYVFN